MRGPPGLRTGFRTTEGARRARDEAAVRWTRTCAILSHLVHSVEWKYPNLPQSERFPAKWIPVRVKKTRQKRSWSPVPIQSEPDSRPRLAARGGMRHDR